MCLGHTQIVHLRLEMKNLILLLIIYTLVRPIRQDSSMTEASNLYSGLEATEGSFR